MGYSRYLKSIYLFTDFFLLNLIFCLVSFYFKWPRLTADPQFLAQFIYINLFWLMTITVVRIHEIDRGLRFEQILTRLLKACVLFSGLMIAFLYFFEDHVVSVYHPEVKLAVWSAFFLLWRSAIAFWINTLRRKGRNFRRVIIVGGGQPAIDMISFIENHPETGYKLAGVFSDHNIGGSHPLAGPVSAAKDFILKNKVNEIYCSLSELEESELTALMDFADNHMLRFKVIPDFRGLLNRKVKIDFYDLVPVLTLRNEPLQNYFNRMLKRAFDLMFSLLVILLVFPLVFLVVAPLIKLTSPGPVFFRQLRSGRYLQDFYCYKFRTMRVNAQADSLQSFEGDQRVTPIGMFLRKTSLDELPQFFNVLMGNMSVVGPRPHMLQQSEEYARLVKKYRVRQLVKPGVTGWLQIHGFRADSRQHHLMEKRVEFDVWYVENWSLLLDLKIVLITAGQVLSGKNRGY